MYVFAGTMMTEKWWNRLPMSVSWAMFLDTFLVSLYAYKMLKGLFAAIIETGRPKKEDNIDRREAFAKNERAKSLFDVTSSSERRSSIFESIDIGALSTASDSSSDFVKEE
jgi:hypothetical protein